MINKILKFPRYLIRIFYNFLPKLTRIVSVTYRIVPTICEHVIAGKSLASCGITISIDESAEVWIVISALEIIELCLLVVSLAMAPKIGSWLALKNPPEPAVF